MKDLANAFLSAKKAHQTAQLMSHAAEQKVQACAVPLRESMITAGITCLIVGDRVILDTDMDYEKSAEDALEVHSASVL